MQNKQEREEEEDRVISYEGGLRCVFGQPTTQRISRKRKGIEFDCVLKHIIVYNRKQQEEEERKKCNKQRK